MAEGRTPAHPGNAKPAKVIYVAQPRNEWAFKTAALAGDAAVMLDARSIGEYTGKDAGGAHQAGHVPGTKSLPWTLLSGAPGNRFHRLRHRGQQPGTAGRCAGNAV